MEQLYNETASVKLRLFKDKFGDRISYHVRPTEGFGQIELFICVKPGNEQIERELEADEFQRDEGVLDTWFSSALWPHSTLGWPEQTEELKYYYPTSVLITSRDIITLWVARMVLMGLHNVGEVPFRDVFIHPKILDGYGEGMSKSKGNGVDPVDVMEKFGADSLRFGLAYLTTETQDVRMAVEFECPHCQKLIEQTRENRTRPRIKCKHCGQPFSTQWAEKPEDKALPRGAVVSDRFELARNFCNKLWNASRFAMLNLDGFDPGRVADDELLVEDSWILSRLSTVTATGDRRPGRVSFCRRRPHALRFCLGRVLQFLRGNGQRAAARRVRAGGRPAGAGPHARHDPAAPAPDDSVPDRGRLAAVGPDCAGAGHRRGGVGGREHHAGALAGERSGPAGRGDRGPVRPFPGSAPGGPRHPRPAGRGAEDADQVLRPLRGGGGRIALSDGALLRRDGERPGDGLRAGRYGAAA